MAYCVCRLGIFVFVQKATRSGWLEALRDERISTGGALEQTVV